MTSSRAMIDSAEKVLKDRSPLPTPEAFSRSTGLKINECERLIRRERERQSKQPSALT